LGIGDWGLGIGVLGFWFFGFVAQKTKPKKPHHKQQQKQQNIV